MSKLVEKPQFETTRPDFELYASEHSKLLPGLFARLERDTHFASTTPGMLSGPMLGSLLSMISHMVKPSRILEIGTFTGYSAICLASGLAPGGELHTIDNNPEIRHIAASYFSEAGLTQSIKMFTGNALDIFPQLTSSYDLIFIDADKENYVSYYHESLRRLSPGGFILVDNVLWYGKVMQAEALNDKETRGIAAFNELVQADSEVENLMLPVRDGLMMIRRRC